MTLAPIGIPSRILKVAIDLRARRIVGFCPVIVVRSLIAPSSSFASFGASPTPMFTTTFTGLGTCMTFVKPQVTP